MKIGLIGERHNSLSYAMLERVLDCPGVELLWFVDGAVTPQLSRKLYGGNYDEGVLGGIVQKLREAKRRAGSPGDQDCKALCRSRGIAYIFPKRRSINRGLPQRMYADPQAEFVFIAGCDQLIDAEGMRLAKRKFVNYHYSPLPAYRGTRDGADPHPPDRSRTAWQRGR